MVSRGARPGASAAAASSGTSRPVWSSKPALTRLATASTRPEPHSPAGSQSPITVSDSPSGRDRDRLDGAVGGPHPAPDGRALEGRPGRRGGREQPVAVAEHDLAVRADVDEQPGPRVPVHAGREQPGGDVAADVGAERREHERPRPRMRRHARVGSEHLRQLAGRHDERRDAERLRVDAERDVGHRRVPGDGDLGDVSRIRAGLRADLARPARRASRARAGREYPAPPGRAWSR